jgi:hypothetical protein
MRSRKVAISGKAARTSASVSSGRIVSGMAGSIWPRATRSTRTRRRFDVHFRRHPIAELFADIVVNDLILVEVKSCPTLEPTRRAQVINDLRASTLEVGLLVNVGPKRQVERAGVLERERPWWIRVARVVRG